MGNIRTSPQPYCKEGLQKAMSNLVQLATNTNTVFRVTANDG